MTTAGVAEWPAPGDALTSTRDLIAAHFASAAPLRVTARHAHGSGGMLSFDCSVWSSDETPLAEGRLNVYIPEDPDQLLETLQK